MSAALKYLRNIFYFWYFSICISFKIYILLFLFLNIFIFIIYLFIYIVVSGFGHGRLDGVELESMSTRLRSITQKLMSEVESAAHV